MPPPSEWFCALLDTAPDVYFRYALTPPRGFAYVSPSVQSFTGRAPDDFYADRNLCLSLIVAADRPRLRRLLRSRPQTTTIRVLRNDVAIPIEVRTVVLRRRGRPIAIEGVARLAIDLPAVTSRVSHASSEPVQGRLAALMFEVHELLHRVLPPAERPAARTAPRVLTLGGLTLDADRLLAAESGKTIALTPKEVMLLKYFLERRERVVTRKQLLHDVWSYQYDGDDRTVDVHVARLRRKLPSLAGRLTAVRGIGYRLRDDDHDDHAATGS